MTREANYPRPNDHDLTNAVFPLYSFTLQPLGKAAGSGKRSAAVAQAVFIGCQSKTSMDAGDWPLKGDSHKINLDYTHLKAIHQQINAEAAAGTLHVATDDRESGLLRIIEIIEEVSSTIETKPNGDYNPLYTRIPAGVDIELP